MKCIQCNKEFESSRITARYCSSACRVKFGRVSVTNDIITRDVSVTNPLSVTEKEEVSVTSDSVTGVSVTLDEPCVTDNSTEACKYLGKNIHLDRDNSQSIIYDVSEDGFRRRNKHWDTHAESYRKMIREGAIRRKAERIEHVKIVQARREAIKYQEA